MEKNDDSGELEANFKEGLFVGSLQKDSSIILYNHLAMTVKTHNVSAGSELRIVGFEIEQRSIARGASLDSEAAPLQYLRYANGTIADGSKGMLFSYSIKTVNDDSTTWASRLDHYYAIGKYDVHMKQIIIALVIMLICSSLAIGYVRVSVTRDFALLAGGVSGSSIRGR